MISIIILYYNIIILWDQHRICGLLFTEMSLCGTWLYLYRMFQEESAILWNSIPQLKFHRYNKNYLYPKLNNYRNNDKIWLEEWQLLQIYWLWNMLIKIQPDATVCRYLFTAKSLYMFQVSQHPSSGVLKTVTETSGTGHNTGTATSLQRGLTYMGAVTPETCRVTLQWINICILLHLVGFLLTLNYDARNHEFKIYEICIEMREKQ